MGTDRAGAPARKQYTAALSVASNSVLILLKVIAGTLTGSIAILTEAVHSSIDLVASVVALVSVRISGEPADEGHLYGHDKVENLAAMIEAILILVGSLAMAFAATRRLIQGGSTQSLWLGIAIVALSTMVNLVVSGVISHNARVTRSPALAGDAAHLRTDALSSGGVVAALVLVKVTGQEWIDPVAALLVAGVILVAGLRLLARAGQVLMDRALPPAEMAAIDTAVGSFADRGIIGYHQLRTRSGGSQRYVDMHVQFRAGTSLEQAHLTAHDLQHEIATALGGADVLIHLEPESRLRPGQQPLPKR